METGETVLAVMPRDRLTTALTLFHRAGYGHVIRVLDPERAPIPAQLARAGVHGARLTQPRGGDDVLLLVHAPARTGHAAGLAAQAGATDTEVVARERSVTDSVAPGLISVAGDRRSRRGSRQRRETPQPPPRTLPEAQVAD